MPFFKIDYPTNQKETDINNSFWEHFDFISKKSQEVFENDLPKEMSNSFRRYGAINQFNKNYHYYKFMLGKPGHDRFTSHRYRTQIIAALLERNFDLDFEVHHYSQEKDDHGKNMSFIYDETKKGYGLAPAYDITSTPNKFEHEMTILGNGKPTKDDVTKIAIKFGLKKIKTDEIIKTIETKLKGKSQEYFSLNFYLSSKG